MQANKGACVMADMRADLCIPYTDKTLWHTSQHATYLQTFSFGITEQTCIHHAMGHTTADSERATSGIQTPRHLRQGFKTTYTWCMLCDWERERGAEEEGKGSTLLVKDTMSVQDHAVSPCMHMRQVNGGKGGEGVQGEHGVKDKTMS